MRFCHQINPDDVFGAHRFGDMPAAYHRFAATGAAFHYVSSSPWHLAKPLLDFLGANGLPLSSIALKQVCRPKALGSELARKP
jgi:phosphatidate phosphatase APP1